MSYTISELASVLDLPHQGDGQLEISRVSSLDDSDRSSLVFFDAEEWKAASDAMTAGCIVTTAKLVRAEWNAIISETPKLDFARAAALVHPQPVARHLRHATADVSSGAQIDDGVEIGAWCSVANGVRIGTGSVLHAGVVIGDNCVLGEGCVLHPRVVLYPGVTLGARVVLHAGVVVGGDGFGYVFDGDRQVKFPQVGRAVIEDDVEVGANTTIDRGSLGVTRIGRGSKIDNLVQIGHNVRIGSNVVIAAQTGISGSTIIEDCAVIGGQVGFGDHARVEKGAVIGSKAGVLPGKIVRGGEVYWGVPVRPLREFKRLNALFGRLPQFKAQLDSMSRTLADIEKTIRKSKPSDP